MNQVFSETTFYSDLKVRYSGVLNNNLSLKSAKKYIRIQAKPTEIPLAGIILFALLKGLLEIFEKFVALLPVRAKAFIKKASEFIKKLLPDRLAAFKDHIA